MADERLAALPRYVHTIEIYLERDSALDDVKRLDLLLTGLYQMRRVSTIRRIERGPAAGDQVLQFEAEMTCPPHEMHGAALCVRVSNERRLADPR